MYLARQLLTERALGVLMNVNIDPCKVSEGSADCYYLKS